MIANRRALLSGLAGLATVGIAPRAARSQRILARQYHPQPLASHLHIYLTKLWDAVRDETDGQLDVTVYAQNNGATIADPEILKQLRNGELEFFVLNGNILSQAHPSADIQGIPCVAKLFHDLVLRSLRSRRLEGRPRAAAVGAILRDAVLCTAPQDEVA